MAEKNKVKININGHSYTIIGNDDTKHIRQVGAHVDEKMKEIATHYPLLDNGKVAVLSAINIADEYLKLKEELEELKKNLQEG